MDQFVGPRLERRDEKLNAQLVPLNDPTGRLFLASEGPVPVDQNLAVVQQQTDMKYGVVTINEVRSERGLPPVAWSDVPWLSLNWDRTDAPAPRRGRQPGRIAGRKTADLSTLTRSYDRRFPRPRNLFNCSAIFPARNVANFSCASGRRKVSFAHFPWSLHYATLPSRLRSHRRPARLPHARPLGPPARHAAKGPVQVEGTRVPQGRHGEGPDGAEPRRALRRELDHHRERGPHPGCRLLRHERQPVLPIRSSPSSTPTQCRRSAALSGASASRTAIFSGSRRKSSIPPSQIRGRWAARGRRTRCCRSSRPGCSTGSRSVFSR